MILKPVPVDTIIGVSTRHASFKIMKSIEQFMESPAQAVELHWQPGEYANASSVHGSYLRAIRRMHVRCRVVQRDYRVYLIKEDVLDDN